MIVLHTVLLALCLYGLYISVEGDMPGLAFLNALFAGLNLGWVVVYILKALQ